MRGLGLILAVLASGPAMAAQEKTIGDWMVTVEKDRFSSAGEATKTIALRAYRGDGLAVRCFPNGLSIAIFEGRSGAGRFDEGMIFDVKFRADEGKIVDTMAIGLNDKTVEVGDGENIAPLMLNAKEYAFRLGYKSVTIDKVFPAGKGAKQAIDTVLKACAKP
ncbi:MAG: hypothetical protein AB1592_13240 [Pseudomonadota bacterium]